MIGPISHHPAPQHRGDAPARSNGVGAAFRRFLGFDGHEEAPQPVPAVAPLAPPPAHDPYAEMDRVRAFLAANGLPPSPDNYALVHRVLIQRDALVSHIVQRLMVAEGRLSPEAAARVVAESKTDFPPELIEKLVSQARDGLSDLAGIVGQSRDDAQAYGDALEMQAESLVESGPSPDLVGQFVDLTRNLIARTRDAETRMQQMGDRIEELQADLDEASRVAECDPLTGLPNRRALERRLAKAIVEAREQKGTVTLAYCDIDHFKAVNDTHGHDVGDRVLKFVGELLSSAADEDTLISRYGGEEFVMLFERVPFTRAMATVNELRLDLGGRTLHVRDSGETIGDLTLSAGVAPLEDGQDNAALLQSADRALYAAKKLGRDRVVSARDPRVAGSKPHRP